MSAPLKTESECNVLRYECDYDEDWYCTKHNTPVLKKYLIALENAVLISTEELRVVNVLDDCAECEALIKLVKEINDSRKVRAA